MLKKTLTLAAAASAMMIAAPALAQEAKIGFLADVSGPIAGFAPGMVDAGNLAIANVNDQGGLLDGQTLTSVLADSACDGGAAGPAADRLVNAENVIAIFGGYCSGATIPTLKIFGDAKLPFIITAANSTKLIPANPGNAFMINSTGNDQVAKAIDVWKAKGVKSLAIVNEGDAYSQDLATLAQKSFTEGGGTVADFETVNHGEQDFSSVVTKIKAANPDAVFWTAYDDDGGPFIKQLREGGYQGAIYVGDGSTSTNLLKLAGGASEGVFAFSSPTAEFLPDAKAFADAYQAKFNVAPSSYGPLTYDGMKLLADAISKAGGTDSAKVIDALSKEDYKGLAGEISFRPDHTLARSNFIVIEAKGGAWALAQ